MPGDNLWSNECHTEPGNYFLKCMENNQKSEIVVVYMCNKLNVLRCDMDIQQGNFLEHTHENLTDVTWCRV
jgi:hypothetical protein